MPPLNYTPPSWLTDVLGNASGEGVDVGVIDSGIDSTWKDPRIQSGVGLVNPNDDFAVKQTVDVTDRIGHGTTCADVILHMAPGARVHPVRVFNRRLETSVEVLVAALEWCVESGIRIANLSLGTALESALDPLSRACECARRKGMVIVSAVNSSTGWSYPAVFESAIGVEADRFLSPYDFAFRCDDPVECIAHGEGNFRGLNGESRLVYGASFAAPHISGLAARWMERHPGARLDDVRQALASHLRPPSESRSIGERKET